MPKTKPKFQIGDWVQSDFIFQPKETYHSRYSVSKEWRRTFSPIEGRIVGGTYKQDGKRLLEEEGYIWKKCNTHFFYLVSVGFTNKPYYVAEVDIELLGYSRFVPEVPFRKVNISEADRKLLSDQSKDWPRDEKGRFK